MWKIGKILMDKYFQDLIDEFGEPTSSEKVDLTYIESYLINY